MRTIVLLLVAFLSFLNLAPPSAAAPQKEVLALAETLETGDLGERIAAAQSLGELGKRAAKATPALVRSLAADDATLVDASVTALVAIGGKALPALNEALASGKFESAEVPRGPVARALLQMGKKAEKSVDAYVASAEPGEELFTLFEEFGDAGVAYLVDAATSSPDHALAALRSLRRLAAKDVRAADTIAPTLKKVKDAELARAATLSWTQEPKKGDLDALRGWMKSDRPELVDTGLWCAGLLGKDAAAAAAEIESHIRSDEWTTRRTALWALASLAAPGPGEPTPFVPGSYPGASKKAAGALEDVNASEVFTIWRDSGKSLGYRGRVGDKARELWALAPAWTSQVTPLPEAPERASLPGALVSAETELLTLARASAAELDGAPDAALASRALAASGATSEAAMEMWVAWLSADNLDLRLEALIGLRAIGRGAIAHEALIIEQLKDPATRVAAAQVLTAIATPSAWTAAVEAVAAIDGKPPYAMLLAISRYDVAALRPGLERFRELYHGGHYFMAAFLVRFGEEAVDDFAFELGASLSDRRMVAAESLGHLGPVARPALPQLEKLSERSPISQKLVRDAIARIK